MCPSGNLNLPPLVASFATGRLKMLTNSRDISIRKTAWINYRGRLRDTLSLLAESFEEAGDAEARDQISAQIRRHDDYLRRAERRIAELSP